MFFVKIPPILNPTNYFSGTYHNYSNVEKLFTENFLNYWINFVKYNDPNYFSSSSNLTNWQPFVDTSTSLTKMNASQKLATGRYLVFGQDSIYMKSGFASHNCDFWNYTNSATKTFRLNSFSYSQQQASILFLIHFILF